MNDLFFFPFSLAVHSLSVHLVVAIPVQRPASRSYIRWLSVRGIAASGLFCQNTSVSVLHAFALFYSVNQLMEREGRGILGISRKTNK
jgi:hypothetical protein